MDPLKLSAADVEKLPEAQALEVLAAHVKAKQTEVPEALAGSASKPLARAAKKALYQLRSSGVAVAEPVAAAGAQPDLKTAPSELDGLLSPVLGTGERMLFFGRPTRGGGVEFFQCVLHDEYGVQQLDRAETNRSRYRRQQREIVSSGQVIEIPLSRVLDELGQYWGQNLRAKNGLPTSAHQNLRDLKVVINEALLEIPKPQGGDEELTTKSASLHDEVEIQSWLPAETQIAALGAELDVLRSAGAPTAMIEAKVRTLAKTYFTEAVRELYARRLWRMGEFFEKTGRTLASHLARAQARRLFHEGDLGGFGVQLFQKVVDLSEHAGPKRPSLGAPR